MWRRLCIKIFITPFLLSSMIAALYILLTIGIFGDILVILYFATIGWFFELFDNLFYFIFIIFYFFTRLKMKIIIGICEEDKFLIKGLTTSWEPLRYLLEKIGNFYSNPLSE